MIPHYDYHPAYGFLLAETKKRSTPEIPALQQPEDR
jgi:hypothetical protein